MNRRHSLGAIGFPAFLLAWTTGVAGVMAQFQQAPAALDQVPQEPAAVAAAGFGRSAPAAAATSLRDAMADPAAWRDAMVSLRDHSEVMNGSWQPADSDSAGQSAAATRSARVAAIGRTDQARSERVAAIKLTAVAPRLEALPAPGPTAEASAAEPDQPGRVQTNHVATARTNDVEQGRSLVRKTPVGFSRSLANDKAAARRSLAEGRVFEAYHRLRPQVSVGRHDTEFLGLLALSALHTGSHGEAMIVYRRLAGLEPEVGRWRTGLALAQEGLGLDATGEYRQALALTDGSGELEQALVARLGEAI